MSLFESLKAARAAWKASKQAEKDAEGPSYGADDRRFLPAAIEMVETPASPVGRSILTTIILLVFIAIGWAIFSHIDVVASATGKIVHQGRQQTLQPIAPGQVTEILVSSGQMVAEGEPLVVMDPTEADVDVGSLEITWREALRTAARQRALLTWNQENVVYTAPDGVSAEHTRSDTAIVQKKVEELRTQLRRLDFQIAEVVADGREVTRSIERLEALMPLTREEYESKANLLDKDLVARPVVLEIQRTMVGMQHDLVMQRERLLRTDATRQALEAEREQIALSFQRQALETLAQAEREAAEVAEQLRSARRRQELAVLRAPVTGRVLELNVTTVGQVVQAGEPVLTMIPEGQLLAVEVNIPNKDIGFIHEGQDVQVKIDTFQFTKYGLIPGSISSISPDVVQDEQLGPVYKAKVAIERTSMAVGEREVPLVPGMTVTADIRTGERRLIEFFLGPLLATTSEALRER